MKQKSASTKSYGKNSYSAFVIGVICFFTVFVPPTRIAMIGNSGGDIFTLFLTVVGIFLSIIGIASKKEKKWLPIVALVLSSSFFIFWVIVSVLLVSGQMDFAP